MNCIQTKEQYDIQVECCEVCHNWYEEHICRGYFILNDKQSEICCAVMSVLEKRKMLGECKNGVFAIRL